MHLPVTGLTVLRTEGRSIDAISIKDGAIFLVLSTDAVTLWHADTLTQFHCMRRVTASLESTGFNRRVFLRSDEMTAIVQTTGNALLVYDLCEDSDEGARVYRTLGGNGIPRITLQHRQNIRVEAGVQALCATEHELVISTKKPPMIQTLKWRKGGGSVQADYAPLSSLAFLHSAGHQGPTQRIVEMMYSVLHDVYVWLTNAGHAYLVHRSDGNWKGTLLHKAPSAEEQAVLAAFNSATSTVSISLANNQILMYDLNAPNQRREVHAVEKGSGGGSIRSLMYSTDGLTLLVCAENGWALRSVSGHEIHSSREVPQVDSRSRPDTSAVQATREITGSSFEPQELRCAIWIRGSYSCLVLPIDEDTLMVRNFCISSDLVLRHPRRLQYHGSSERSELADSSLTNITLPVNVDAFAPLLYAGRSSCGRFIAVGGRFGLAHYSVSSKLWKTHANYEDMMDMSLTAAPVWYHHLLIVSVRTLAGSNKLVVLSREYELENVLAIVELADTAVLLAVQDGIVYTILASCELHTHQLLRRADSSVTLTSTNKHLLPQICKTSGSQFRTIAIVQEGEERQCRPLLLLQGHTLYLLTLLTLESATNESLSHQVMARNIEWFALSEGGAGRLKNALLAFEGRDVLIWFNLSMLQTKRECDEQVAASVKFGIDFVPRHVVWHRGLIEGFATTNREGNAEHMDGQGEPRTQTRSFVPEILETLLREQSVGEAFVLSSKYVDEPQFAYYLELLLYRALEDALDARPKFLRATWSLLEKYRDLVPKIVVACARKSEVSSWQTLFDVTGPPMSFYEECLAKGDLKTAGAYLIVLMTFDTSLGHRECTLDLIGKAVATKDWDLATELARFYSVVTEDRSAAQKEIYESISGLL